MPVEISNPYAMTGTRWLKGEIHAHVNKARDHAHVYKNGKHANRVYLDASAAGLDFVCMSVEVAAKHGGVAHFGDVGGGRKHGVTGIPAREIQNNYYKGYFKGDDAKYLHVLTLGENDGVSLCVHPMYYETANHRAGGEWRSIQRALRGASGTLGALGVCGLEIYNAFSFMRFQKKGKLRKYEEYEEECWDDILTKGHLYWGFVGNDSYYSDAYRFRHIPYLGLVHVAVDEGFEEAHILAALKRGRFYSSTGIELAPKPIKAGIQGDVLMLEVEATERVNWVCHVQREQFRERILIDDRAAGQFAIADHWRYLRVSCYHPTVHWKRAWLQPITNTNYFGI